MGNVVRVLYFGAAQELTGKSSEKLNAGDTGSLCRVMLEKYPSMRTLSFRIALNRNLLREESVLMENDEIAILPPLQGG